MAGLMISQREAVLQLSTTARPRLTPRLAEGVLVSGFAGPATPLANVNLYDEHAVRRLAAAPLVRLQELPAACRSAMLVVRASARPGWVQRAPEERVAHARGPFWFSPWVRVHLSILLERNGFVPVVATVASYVLGVAEVSTARAELDQQPTRTFLDLVPPGTRTGHDWSAALRGKRFVTPPGNNWLWWTPRSQPRRSAS